jgi:hypothetical protein
VLGRSTDDVGAPDNAEQEGGRPRRLMGRRHTCELDGEAPVAWKVERRRSRPCRRAAVGARRGASHGKVE